MRWRYPFSEFNREFEAPVLHALRGVARPGALVLDVGANFGLFTIYAARLVGEHGHVIAFEPSSTADALADHARLNRVEDRVEVLPMMVGEDAGEGELWEAPDSTFSSISRSAAARGDSASGHTRRLVRPMTSIDRFCDERQLLPDLIKIDVEGAEGKVLRGARNFLAKRHGHIVLELHPSVLHDLGEKSGDVLREIEDQGWTATKIHERGEPTDPAATVHYVFSAPASR